MESAKQKISACLVVYNEEKNIRRCLDSLVGAVDEIIVVHDGECQDETLVICREYGGKIFVRPHVGAMEAHLVFAIQQSTGNWLMRIDADEFLSAELKLNLRNLVEEAEKNKISAYSFYWLNFSETKFILENKRKAVLFKKSDLYWFSIPHLDWQTRGRLFASNNILGHILKNHESVVYWVNQKKWAKIQAEYILKKFRELDNFQATEEDWFKAYDYSRRYAGSLFLPVLKFLKSFSGAIITCLSLKEAWRQGLYNFYLGKYLYDIANHRKL